MLTVQDVLAKDSWNETDIKVLMANVATLPLSVLVKLGLAPAPKVSIPVVVKEPVKVETAKVVEPSPKKETLQRRGRPSKK